MDAIARITECQAEYRFVGATSEQLVVDAVDNDHRRSESHEPFSVRRGTAFSERVSDVEPRVAHAPSVRVSRAYPT